MSITNQQQNDETNGRIYSRNVPQQMLQPYFDIKPASVSKCSVFPVFDTRSAQEHAFPTYNINTMFNPGNRKAPWSGFTSRVEDESILRNQIYPLQKSNAETTYVPSSTSDLYLPFIGQTQGQGQQHFPYLEETYVPPNIVSHKPTDPLTFGNHTRTQLE
jgi:hypothetical protein